jgi:glucokinase
MALHTVGIDIGENRVSYGLFDGAGNILTRRAHETDEQWSPDLFFSEIAKQTRLLAEEGDLSISDIAGVGISMPSQINASTGIVHWTHGLPKLSGFSANEKCMGKFGNIRTVIDKRANAGALAEHRFGAGRDQKNMLYCLAGAELSTGIIINNALFRGSHGFAGATGHMIIQPQDPKGLPCVCGSRGCINSYGAGSMIVKHVEEWIKDGEYTLLTEMAGNAQRVTARHLSMAYERGDALATKAIEQMAQYLGIWLYNIHLSYDIDFIVLGGGLLRMGRKLTGRIQKVFNTCNNSGASVQIVIEQLGEDRKIIGANQLLKEKPC